MKLPDLPHGPGFRFLDTIELDEDVTVLVGHKWLDPELPFFVHHFPGQPIMPGVLLIECAAQAAGCLWNETKKSAANIAFLAQVGQFRFMKQVLPGQTLHVTVKIEKDFGKMVQFDAEIRADQDTVARGKITLAEGGKRQ